MEMKVQSSRRTSSSSGATPSPLARRTTQPRRASVKIRGMSEDLDDFEVETEQKQETEKVQIHEEDDDCV